MDRYLGTKPTQLYQVAFNRQTSVPQVCVSTHVNIYTCSHVPNVNMYIVLFPEYYQPTETRLRDVMNLDPTPQSQTPTETGIIKLLFK